MTHNPDANATPLASLVNAGEGQSAAIPINDFVFMSQDISNAYLVTTRAGDVLVNTGSLGGAERHKRLFDKVRTGPLRYIVLTQSHADHTGGVAALREPETEIITHRLFPETRDYFRRLGPFLIGRAGKLWNRVLPSAHLAETRAEFSPDILTDDRYAFEVGGRRFEALSTPGGETVDSLSLWLPDDKIVFTGNLFGPVLMSMPFLNTVRGDRPRLVRHYLTSLERVRALEPEMLITGHGEPVVGAAQVQKSLVKLRDAVTYVKDATEAGMNAGKDVYTLMREIRLPPDLAIGEYHGKVSWSVRSIYHENAGWFLYDSTTSLYGVPRASIDTDLAELAGGADKLAARARQRLERGEPLQAIHLIDIALGVSPANKPALQVKRDALNKLLVDSGSVNLSETMWLKSEIAATEEALG